MDYLKHLLKLLRETKAATAIEYGLIAALIAVVVILSVKYVGTNLNTSFGAISTNLNTANK